MGWFAPECPVTDTERAWIETSLDWMVGEFGVDVLHRPVVVPTERYFPGDYSGRPHEVHALFGRIRDYLDIPAERVTLELVEDDDNAEVMAALPVFEGSFHGVIGQYIPADRPIIALRGSQARDLRSLVATIAHELGHERLLGERRIQRSRPDHEPLTDLLTVFLGMGIFTANAAREFRRHEDGWRHRRTGYLTERMYGYALASYAWRRDEKDPAWSEFLDANPRGYLRDGLAYLRAGRGPAR